MVLYTPDFPNWSVSQHVIDWLAQVNGRFQPDIMGQATAFMDVISLTWSYIFGPTGSVNGLVLQPFRYAGTDLT